MKLCVEVPQEETIEFIGRIIDIFEDFLEEKGITIDNPEKEDSENPCIIYGSDYGFLEKEITSALQGWDERSPYDCH